MLNALGEVSWKANFLQETFTFLLFSYVAAEAIDLISWLLRKTFIKVSTDFIDSNSNPTTAQTLRASSVRRRKSAVVSRQRFRKDVRVLKETLSSH